MLKHKLLLVLAGFNEGAAKSFIKSYTDPIFSTLIWLAFVVSGVVYLLKDEEDRDRKKFSKQAKVILVVTVVIMSASIIFNIVGIATS